MYVYSISASIYIVLLILLIILLYCIVVYRLLLILADYFKLAGDLPSFLCIAFPLLLIWCSGAEAAESLYTPSLAQQMEGGGGGTTYTATAVEEEALLARLDSNNNNSSSGVGAKGGSSAVVKGGIDCISLQRYYYQHRYHTRIIPWLLAQQQLHYYGVVCTLCARVHNIDLIVPIAHIERLGREVIEYCTTHMLVNELSYIETPFNKKLSVVRGIRTGDPYTGNEVVCSYVYCIVYIHII